MRKFILNIKICAAEINDHKLKELVTCHVVYLKKQRESVTTTAIRHSHMFHVVYEMSYPW